MTITFSDTRTGDKIPLVPMEEGHVKMYVCGITAYDYCHIGHARSALVFDMIYRYLQQRGYKVTFVRNFTDIDDKIINRAAEQNTTTEELAERFIRMFHEDMGRLGILSPTLEPKATEHIPQIISLIEELIARGFAYQEGADVYFSVDKYTDYGQLSGRSLEDMQAGARISVNESKQNPMDFALWKGSKPGEPTWDSPWGPGRPGWHIECSAMSREYLGDEFDIHGGGKDLVFPHHENEIAQSCCATGKPFARAWIHHGFVTIKDEKMSKSLGNFLTIREILEQFEPEVLRLLVFSTHYRNPLDFSHEAMEGAASGLNRLYGCLAEIAQLPKQGAQGKAGIASREEAEKLQGLPDQFRQAMDNDFNSAQALGIMFEAVKDMNRIRQALPGKPATTDLNLLHSGAAALRELGAILGLLGEEPIAYIERRQAEILRERRINPDDIDKLISQRIAARAAKDWQQADAIRDQLLELGIEIRDSSEGTTWKVRM